MDINNSILLSIKNLLGIASDDDSFDSEIIIHINASLDTLGQMGIGDDNTNVIDKNTQWATFLKTDKFFESAKLFVYLETRLMFDPPQNSFVVSSIEKRLEELAWRLTVEAREREREVANVTE